MQDSDTFERFVISIEFKKTLVWSSYRLRVTLAILLMVLVAVVVVVLGLTVVPAVILVEGVTKNGTSQFIEK